MALLLLLLLLFFFFFLLLIGQSEATSFGAANSSGFRREILSLLFLIDTVRPLTNILHFLMKYDPAELPLLMGKWCLLDPRSFDSEEKRKEDPS